MSILAIDTCLESCSVATGAGLGTGCARIHARSERMATGQAERLVPMIDEVMSEAGLAFQDIDRIAVTTGPGSFTGMRIGIAAARALALSLGVPVVTLSSFEVMALSPDLAEARKTGLLVVTTDARRGQLYAQLFEPNRALACHTPVLLPIAGVAQLGGTEPVVFAGAGAGLAADAAAGIGRRAAATLPDLQPDMRFALEAAAQAIPSATPPRPLYLRPPDAKPQDGKSLARAP